MCMINELRKEIEELGFKTSIAYVLIDDNYKIYEEEVIPTIYAYNFQTKFANKLNDNLPEIHLDYITLFDEFKNTINNNSNKELNFRSNIINGFNFDELMQYDFTKLYRNLNLPQLNLTYHLNDFENYKLGICLYVIFEDYDEIGDIEKFETIIKPIVNKYEKIILRYYNFVKYDEIIEDFETDSGLIVHNYFPPIYEAKILLNLDNPEKILINKLLLDLNAI